MGEIIQSSFADAWPLLNQRRVVYIVLAVIAALSGLYVMSLPQTATLNYGPIVNIHASNAINVAAALGGIAAWFAMPATVRSVDPSFGMTVGRFFGIIGIAIVYGIVVGIGFMLVFIPGFWFFIKWSQVVWAYLLRKPGETGNPFGESWHVTTGRFWETFLFLLLVGIVGSIPLYVVGGIAIWIATLVRPLTVIMLPVAFLAYVFFLNFEYLAGIRWYVRLRERAHGPLIPA